ncbi:melanoma-associated antigen C3-like [Callithrix jacchus]|uniref:melanoma-associated antigen C2-like n=1 Tax=Callithrix jacchus TaxID=9483 RepID=UPI00159DE729|nr:melanoma-associated antigen C2-like [Callithrix jacchus]XP_035146060.1 melanoma-associated antigen C2-like [Callithrix jacchus]XP_035146061.1 melanoma-associated antigen C2-like [Callithrix jacchus]XP_035146062.1 melanoma-associated antigen C2-like [Callithrix jacchus]
MPLFPNLSHLGFEQDLQNPTVIEDLVEAQDSIDEEEEDASSSSSFHFLFPSSSSSSSSLCTLFLSASEDEEVPVAGIPPLPQSPPEIPPQGSPEMSPQGVPQSSPQSHLQNHPPSPLQNPPQSSLNSCSSPFLWTPLEEESSSGEEQETPVWQAFPDSQSLNRYVLDEKVTELVQYFLLKYQKKEPVTKAEMLTTVTEEYKDYFPMIFGKAHQFIELIFGISLTDMDPKNHCYFFEDTLDLTCEGSLLDDQGMPQNCLLILILSTIFIKGNCVPEEAIWEVLSAIGVYPGREHFIYGEPRELLTKDWVQRKYLEYREVPNSAPPHYEFLWGTRAHSEVSKRKVLEFLDKLSATIPNSFPSWYTDALKDVEGRAQAMTDTADDSTAMASASPSVMSSNFCPE